MPQFRVESDMHSSWIEQIRTDYAHNRLVSIGDDKTIRIWQLPELRLLRTIHVPSDPGNEGLLYGLAVTPEGRTLAVGGWTGWEWDKRGTVYMLDGDTGEILRRITDLPALVGALGFSEDGKKLAVGLHSGAGIQIYDTQTYRLVAEDKEYGERIVYLEYSIDGKLATTANDGYVRLYNADNKLIGRQSVGISTQLGGIRFSPDGKRLVFGIADKAVVPVLSADTMDVLTVHRIEDPKQKGLWCIGWSRDGETLYATGPYAGNGPTPLYRWDKGGLGQMHSLLRVGNQGFTNMWPLPDGGMIFATDSPSFGMVDPKGRLVQTRFGPNGEFRNGAKAFRISNDGTDIVFPMAHDGQKPVRFSIHELQYDARSSTKVASNLKPALQSGANLKVQVTLGDEQHENKPEINKHTLSLEPYETVYSYAIEPKQREVVFSTSWSLRVYNAEGQRRWRTYLPAKGYNVNVSGDGRWAVVTLADGTIRWYAMTDGKETLGLFPHRNGEDWVLWRPDGYYASSVHGDEYVGWLVNRGRDQTPDFYRAIQFERVFYRPDLLKHQLDVSANTKDTIAPEPALSIEHLADFAPPRIKMVSSTVEAASGTSPQLKLDVAVEGSGKPMQEVAVYLNGIPMTPAKERNLNATESKSFKRQFTLPAYQRGNELRVEVFNGVAMGLAEAYVETPKITTASMPKGDLYLLAIGVNQFTAMQGQNEVNVPDLEFAGADASEFAKLLREQGNDHYAKVHSLVLTDNEGDKPSQAAIMKAMHFIEDDGPQDTVVVFLASHGFSDRAGNFYFVPRDAQPNDVKAVFQGEGNRERPQSLISWQDIFNTLRRSAGRRLLIVDTCQAQNVAGTFDAHSLQKRSAASQFALMVASKGSESSQEYPEGHHGLFTYTLLEALRGKADRNGDRIVTASEAIGFAAPLVERLRDKASGPQSPQFMAPKVLQDMQLVPAGTRSPSS